MVLCRIICKMNKGLSCCSRDLVGITKLAYKHSIYSVSVQTVPLVRQLNVHSYHLSVETQQCFCGFISHLSSMIIELVHSSKQTVGVYDSRKGTPKQISKKCWYSHFEETSCKLVSDINKHIWQFG